MRSYTLLGSQSLQTGGSLRQELIQVLQLPPTFDLSMRQAGAPMSLTLPRLLPATYAGPRKLKALPLQRLSIALRQLEQQKGSGDDGAPNEAAIAHLSR